LELERFDLEVGMQNEAVDVVIPEIEALGVSRQQGLVMVRTEGDLRADVTTRTGLLQVDNQQVGNQQDAWDFVYRYAAPPYELVLKIEKLQPRVNAEEFVDIHVLEDQVRVDVTTLFTVERAGVFQVEYNVPEGYTVREVHGVQAGNYQPVVVENHHMVENAPGVYRVNFSRKAFGLVGLRIGLEKRHNDENLVAPTGVASEYTLELARVVPASVEHVRGRVLVLAPEGLRLTPKATAGGQSVAVNEIQAEHIAPLSIRQNARPAQGFRYAEEVFAPVFDVERRKPYIEVGQLVVADVEQGEVQFHAALHYQVRYSGVKTFRLDVPQAIAKLIRNDSSNFITKNEITPMPEDLQDGYVAWELTSNRELLGAVTINLAWNQKLEDLEATGTDTVDVGKLIPVSVDRGWGQLAFKKAENLDLTPQRDSIQGLRPIDPQHDIQLAGDTTGATLAMEFHGDAWNLGLRVNRYQQEDLEKTAVEMGYVRVRLSKGDNAAVHAVFRMRSVDQRIPVKMPANSQLTNDPLRINGASVGLEIDPAPENDRSYFIPLTTQSQGETFVVELVYNISAGSSKITLPLFQEVKAVNQVFVGVEIPNDRVLLAYSGDWDDHLDGSWLEFLQERLVNNDRHFDAHQVINEVTAGYAVSEIYPSNRQKILYFSTINPKESPLTLELANRVNVQMVLFAAIAILGLVGLFLSLRKQLVLMLCAGVASLGVAMISPVLTSSLDLSGVLVGLAMVASVWILKDVASPFVGLSKRLASRPKKSVPEPDLIETTSESATPAEVIDSTTDQTVESSSMDVESVELTDETQLEGNTQLDGEDFVLTESTDDKDLTVDPSESSERKDQEIDSGADDMDEGSETGETEEQE